MAQTQTEEPKGHAEGKEPLLADLESILGKEDEVWGMTSYGPFHLWRLPNAFWVDGITEDGSKVHYDIDKNGKVLSSTIQHKEVIDKKSRWVEKEAPMPVGDVLKNFEKIPPPIHQARQTRGEIAEL